MQGLFGPGDPWAVRWLERVVPAVEAICFVPAARAGEGRGCWAHYYRRWAFTTLDEIGRDAVRLVPALERFTADARG